MRRRYGSNARERRCWACHPRVWEAESGRGDWNARGEENSTPGVRAYQRRHDVSKAGDRYGTNAARRAKEMTGREGYCVIWSSIALSSPIHHSYTSIVLSEVVDHDDALTG
ncbi:hypothetical protein SCHPADRAFT_745755 [Schizopora paradoxa]|uniref:Uncharacterized protein n=1 Tax=Schizopora paradoxa TaxID=27342 RepID=A0A0H2QZD6_9AGAM|nr:hypothetical protein SCHPADRAFT_745755 [Schizopora paradoxa]